MAGREQSPSPSRGTDQKPPDTGGTQTSGSKGPERQHGVKGYGSAGRDVPDQSKEKNTEIAVEAGQKDGERSDKR